MNTPPPASRRPPRLTPDLRHERALWRAGSRHVVGVDEVGRGPLAGPVVVAAVALPAFFDAPWLNAVRDSKQLAANTRERLAAAIRRDALAVGFGAASAAQIDRDGLTAATVAALRSALGLLGLAPDFLLVDALLLTDEPAPQCALVKGDARCLSIACASIVAKVERDTLMTRLDARYPGYGFARHKGYGSAAHLAALARLGPSPIHRQSFAPVRAWSERC